LKKDIEQIISRPMHQVKQYILGLQPNIPEEIIRALSDDPRKAARQFAKHILNRKRSDLRETKRLQNLLQYERELYATGYRLIAGVDEAGVAPLAGPVVSASVILPQNYMLKDLNDSKKILSPEKRDKLAGQIKQDAVCWACGFAEVEEIDRMNVYRASLLAMNGAVKGLSEKPDYLLVDARTIPHCSIPQKAIIHGDALSASIAAASLIAKTTRDRHMIEMDRNYPGYGFAKNKGYPTPEHLEALQKLGPLPIHRRSFAPVRKALQMDPIQRYLFTKSRLDTNSG